MILQSHEEIRTQHIEVLRVPVCQTGSDGFLWFRSCIRTLWNSVMELAAALNAVCAACRRWWARRCSELWLGRRSSPSSWQDFLRPSWLLRLLVSSQVGTLEQYMMTLTRWPAGGAPAVHRHGRIDFLVVLQLIIVNAGCGLV